MSTFIVAECGINWRDLGEAKKMLEVFKECGADACKFQWYKESAVAGHPRVDELKKIMFTPEMAKELKEHAESVDIDIFWTPSYTQAVDELEKLDVNRYKIRSKDAVNTSLLKKVLQTGKETLISVASDRLDWGSLEDEKAMYRVKLLYCIQRYPAKDEEVHLKWAFPALRSYIGSNEYVGYSDHTTGITACIAAVAMGAQIVEKHVMLNREFDWIDSPVSVTPVEFKDMVYHIRRAEVMRA